MHPEDQLRELDDRVAAAGDGAAGRARRVRAQLKKVWLLDELGRRAEALPVADEAWEAMAEVDDVLDRRLAARVGQARGWLLDRRGEPEAAVGAYDAVIALAAGAPEDEPLQAQTAAAMTRKASLLHELGRTEQGLEIAADVVNRFAEVTPAGAESDVRDAMLLFCGLGAELGQVDSAISCYERAIEWMLKSEAPDHDAALARARMSRANLRGQRAELDEAAAGLDEAIRGLGAEPAVGEQRALVARALNDRAHWLRALGRQGEAIESYRSVLRRFATGEDAELDELIAQARTELAELRTDG